VDLAAHDPRVAASLPARVAAGAIDAALVAAVAGAAHLALQLAGSALAHPERASTCTAYLAAIAALPGWIYFSACERAPRGATLGKRLLGLAVVHVYGVPISARRAMVRAAVKMLPWAVALAGACHPTPYLSDPGPLRFRPVLFVAYGLVGLWLASAMMTLKKQSVHDLAAGTYVIRAPRA
jgi:uncharacterized RDD family membrane protein YckC